MSQDPLYKLVLRQIDSSHVNGAVCLKLVTNYIYFIIIIDNLPESIQYLKYAKIACVYKYYNNNKNTLPGDYHVLIDLYHSVCKLVSTQYDGHYNTTLLKNTRSTMTPTVATAMMQHATITIIAVTAIVYYSNKASGTLTNQFIYKSTLLI